MKLNRAWIMVGLATLAVSAYAIYDKHRVTVESNDNKKTYRRVEYSGRVRLVKQLSDKDCVFGKTWGYDRAGIWVDRGCRAEFEYEDGRDTILRPGDILRPSGGYETKRVTVESDNGKRSYRRIDTSGGVRLIKRLSDSPCTMGKSWGYDKNGVWVDDGCRAEFEVRSAKGNSGSGDFLPGLGVPRWAVGRWTGYRNADNLDLEIRSDGTLILSGRNERRGRVRGERVDIGDDVFRLEQSAQERIKLTPVRSAMGTLEFRKH